MVNLKGMWRKFLWLVFCTDISKKKKKSAVCYLGFYFFAVPKITMVSLTLFEIFMLCNFKNLGEGVLCLWEELTFPLHHCILSLLRTYFKLWSHYWHKFGHIFLYWRTAKRADGNLKSFVFSCTLKKNIKQSHLYELFWVTCMWHGQHCRMVVSAASGLEGIDSWEAASVLALRLCHAPVVALQKATQMGQCCLHITKAAVSAVVWLGILEEQAGTPSFLCTQ